MYKADAHQDDKHLCGQLVVTFREYLLSVNFLLAGGISTAVSHILIASKDVTLPLTDWHLSCLYVCTVYLCIM